MLKSIWTGALLAGCLAVPANALALPVSLEAPQTTWPQMGSDVPADPAIQFGVLKNGMRFLIRRNASPAGQVSLRLRIAAGSLYEAPADAGTAHFLEHLAFRGSQNLPDGQALKMLQDLGLSLGADLNAHTSSNQTVYEFDLPHGDAKTLHQGIALTREIAGNLTLAPAAIDSERKVVLAEARQRSGAAENMVRAEFGQLFGDATGNAMLAIGTTQTIEAANAASISKFYHTWYRPDRATLIVVGDVDPAAVEAEIRAQFSNWDAAPAQPEAPALSIEQPQRPHVRIFTENGVPPAAALSFVHPHDPAPDTMATERRAVLREVALAVLNQRFSKMARGDNPPFINANAHWTQVAGLADLAEADAAYAPGQAYDAVGAIQSTLASAVQNGVQQVEVDQAAKNLRSFLEAQAASATSTPSARLAEDYVGDAGRRNVITSPEQDLSEFNAFAHDLNAGQIDAVLKSLFTSVPPQLFVAGPTPPAQSEAAFVTALSAAAPKPSAAEDTPAKTWPYTDFGSPGTVVARSQDAALGVTFVTFSNGVRATIRPSQLQKGQVLVSARFGTGRLGLNKSQAKLLWALQPALLLGGLKRITPDEVERVLAGHSLGVQFGVENDAFAVSGATRPEDFLLQLQLLTAVLTDPAYRVAGFERGRAAVRNQLAQLKTVPDGVLQTRLPQLLHNGDPRFGVPDEAELANTSVEDVAAALGTPLKTGPLEIIVAGDIAADDAIAAISRTFAALPKREDPKVLAGEESLPPLNDAPIVLHHSGGTEQSVALVAWPATGIYPDPQMARTLRVLATVLSTRLFEDVRTAQGLTYTPQAISFSSTDTSGYGFLEAFADVPPGKIGAFYAAVNRAVAALRSAPVPLDELKRARDPMVNDLEHTRETNRYWLGILGGAQADPRRLELIKSLLPDTQRVSPEDVQQAANLYLGPKAWHIVVIPEGGMLTTGPTK